MAAAPDRSEAGRPAMDLPDITAPASLAGVAPCTRLAPMNWLSLIPGARQIIRSEIRGGRLLPLLPRHGIYLTVLDGDGPRFARMFRATWKRLPLKVRRRLLGHWRYHGLSIGELVSSTIELRISWPGSRGMYAMSNRFGHRFRF